MPNPDPMQAVNPWSGALFEWKAQSTWIGRTTKWLEPRLTADACTILATPSTTIDAIDDSAWVDRVCSVVGEDAEQLAENLAAAIEEARIVAYHGCRPVDAGVFHAEGIKCNDPVVLAEHARGLVADLPGLAMLRPQIEARLAAFDDRDRDAGQVYLIADDRLLPNGCGHYLLYGSEWLQVLLGWEAHAALRMHGAPTIFEVHLPLSAIAPETRKELSWCLLREWSRQMATRDDLVPELDFSFVLRRDIPPEWIAGHTHPSAIADPFYGKIVRQNPYRSCAHCEGRVLTGSLV